MHRGSARVQRESTLFVLNAETFCRLLVIRDKDHVARQYGRAFVAALNCAARGGLTDLDDPSMGLDTAVMSIAHIRARTAGVRKSGGGQGMLRATSQLLGTVGEVPVLEEE